MFRPAFGLAQHPKAGRNTQQLILHLTCIIASCYIYAFVPVLNVFIETCKIIQKISDLGKKD